MSNDFLASYIIPVISQTSKLRVQFNNIYYILAFRWCRGDIEGWLMDILSDDDDIPIAAGLPVVTGVDIIFQLKYLNIGDQPNFIFTYTDFDTETPPTKDNFGGQSHLIYGVYTP